MKNAKNCYLQALKDFKRLSEALKDFQRLSEALKDFQCPFEALKSKNLLNLPLKQHSKP